MATENIVSTIPTLDDLPTVPESFCENAPVGYKEQCIACLSSDKYTCKYTYQPYGIEKGTTFYKDQAVKSCCLDMRYAAEN